MSATLSLPTKTTGDDAIRAELALLRAENAKMKADAAAKVVLKVSVKGAVSLYGIQKQFPVTLYPNQWLRVLEMSDSIRTLCDTLIANPEQLVALQNAAIAKHNEKVKAQATASA